MANISLKTIKFPGLVNTYGIPQLDDTLSVAGAAADAKAVGDAIKGTADVSDILPVDTSTGYIPDGFPVDVKDLKVGIVPKQAGTGDPSPENVRAISGWDSVTVMRTGENLLRNATIVQGTFDPNTGGNVFSAGKRIRVDDYIPITPGEYRVGNAENYPYAIYAYDSSKVMIEAETVKSWKGADVPFTITNAAFVRFGFKKSDDSAIAPDEIHNYYCTDGSTIVTYPVPLGRTVYGGTLDVTTGELVVDKAMIESYNGETLPGEWISDRDVYESGTTPTTGAQVVYELATPQTYTLTPQQVTLLKGINNVFADAGTVEVKYSADIQLYIDSKIAETQALVLEN